MYVLLHLGDKMPTVGKNYNNPTIIVSIIGGRGVLKLILWIKHAGEVNIIYNVIVITINLSKWYFYTFYVRYFYLKFSYIYFE